MSANKLTKAEVEALYGELTDLESWVNPKPDPNQWPPAGWQEHPQFPGYYFRMLTEEALREEVFGSEEKREWLRWAGQRIVEIKEALASYFFPKAKEEGTERKTKGGFAVMLKTGLTRKFDVAALATVIAECQKLAEKKKLSINIEASTVKWEPKLELKAYRELPDAIRKEYDNALIVTPTKPEFEIVRVEDEEA